MQTEPNDHDLLTVGFRRVIYILGIAAAIAAPFIAVTSPEYREPLLSASMLLQGVAGVTALAYTPSKGK